MRSGSTPLTLVSATFATLLLAGGTALAQATPAASSPRYVPVAGLNDGTDGSGSDGGASVGASTGATASGVAASNLGGTGLRSQQSTTADMRPGSQSGGNTVTHLIGPGLPPADANQSIRDLNAPIFQVAGFGGYVSAPVTAAYDADNNLATFAGQPGRGSTAVLQQSMYGSP